MSTSLWAEFEKDPRAREHAALRASDRDRALVHGVLAEGYAEGRLDAHEFEERATAVLQAKTLGELPGVVADLVPIDAPLVVPRPSIPDLDRRSREAYRRRVSAAARVFATVTTICWLIWAVTTVGNWPSSVGEVLAQWPVWPMLGTSIPLIMTLTQRRSIVAGERARIERREAKRMRRGLPPTELPGGHSKN